MILFGKNFFPGILLLLPLLATIIVTDAFKYLFMSSTITLVIQVRDVLRVENKNYWISNWLADPRERDLEEMGLHVCTIYNMSLVTPCFSHCWSRVKFCFIYFRASLTICFWEFPWRECKHRKPLKRTIHHVPNPKKSLSGCAATISSMPRMESVLSAMVVAWRRRRTWSKTNKCARSILTESNRRTRRNKILLCIAMGNKQ